MMTRVLMRLLQPLTLAGIVHPAGTTVPLPVDVARHLDHHRRAAPADVPTLHR